MRWNRVKRDFLSRSWSCSKEINNRDVTTALLFWPSHRRHNLGRKRKSQFSIYIFLIESVLPAGRTLFYLKRPLFVLLLQRKEGYSNLSLPKKKRQEKNQVRLLIKVPRTMMDTVYGTKKYFQSLSGGSDIYRSSTCRAMVSCTSFTLKEYY